MYAYQSGVDGQLFVWIDEQKYMSNVSLKKTERNNTWMIFWSVTWGETQEEKPKMHNIYLLG